ncbi:hypothetical protein [Cohnella sp. WQ 127256]|uniref:hypothetical protein n=1 Tax=Cohnella sp. WQ 127256 TaxID=2938790 RepID=UPI002118CC10|nr:hypothetical protein [Cohnella sp. WQ 127256]
MKEVKLKLSNRNFILKMIVLLVVVTVTSMWAYNYFSTKVFYLDDKKYSEKSAQSTLITKYTAWFGKPIRINNSRDVKELQIDEDTYLLKELGSTGDKETYLVTYPSGNVYTVEDVNHSGFLLAYDKNGEVVLGFQAYSNNERILSPGEEYYHPSSLVTAAYDKYHERQGNVFLFILSILFFAYCWCVFRKEAFQRFLFKLSYRLWVVDPEPSDFYFFMTKAGAVGGMVVCGLGLLLSLK